MNLLEELKETREKYMQGDWSPFLSATPFPTLLPCA